MGVAADDNLKSGCHGIQIQGSYIMQDVNQDGACLCHGRLRKRFPPWLRIHVSPHGYDRRDLLQTPLESRASPRPRHEGFVPTRARLPLLLYAASHGCPKSGRSVLLHLSSPNRTAERMESPGSPPTNLSS